jgi:DNA-binding winged helix-turn-helix (wHTH) protein/tetratricopeptide (TPR) repeat protein
MAMLGLLHRSPSLGPPSAGSNLPMVTPPIVEVCRFGPFELDLRSGDLSKNGRRVRLQEKPRSLLLALAERPGKIVTRAELRERLWPGDTFVTFEDGLNTAIRKLRETLEDDARTPRFVETIRGRGYRLLAEAEPVFLSHIPAPAEIASAPHQPIANPISAPTVAELPLPVTHRRLWPWMLLASVVVATVVAWYWLGRSNPAFNSHTPILIASFDNQTGDRRFDQALDTALAVSLEQARYSRIFSRLQADNALRLMHAKPDTRITAAVGREICQRENIAGMVVPTITRTGDNYLLTAQLIDPATGATVRSYSEPAHGEGQILSALDAVAVEIRRAFGESQFQIHRAHRLLPQVTTTSLAALEDYANGQELWKRGKSDEAVSLFEKAIAADPDFAMAHAALGGAYYSFYFNDPKHGELEYHAALNLSSRVTEREHALIEMSFADDQERIEEAKVLYRAYLHQYPDDWPTLYAYAHLLRMHSHASESIAIYQDLLKRSPDDASIYKEMATAYSVTNQWGKSVQSYEKAFAIDPEIMATGNVNREYGFTLVRNGEDAKAEAVFTALLGNAETYATGQRSLAFLDLYHGLYKSARARLLQALTKSDTAYSQARIRYMLAVVAAGQGDRREEIRQLDLIMAKFDELNLKVLYGSLIGKAYARIGEVEKAKNILRRITPLADPHVEDQVEYLQFLKAEIAAAQGDFPGALGFIPFPLKENGESAATLARESLAHIYRQAGNLDLAASWYRQFLDGGSRALGWEPQQEIFEAHFTLAQQDIQKNNRPAAILELQEILLPWRNADQDLPFVKQAIALRDEIHAAN